MISAPGQEKRGYLVIANWSGPGASPVKNQLRPTGSGLREWAGPRMRVSFPAAAAAAARRGPLRF